jgi:protein-disulfide isomerase
MSRLLLGCLAVLCASAAACARTDAATRSETATAAAQPGSSVASASGQLASTGVPNDTISERADRGRILGDSNATVWLIMASDFQCPYCKQWHDASFAAVMRDYVNTGKVRIAFLNYPLSIHPNALPASEAAMCASVQNKFWQMHDALFATQAQWEVSKTPNTIFDSLAKANGVNMKPYQQCVSQHLTVPLLQVDRDRASSAGVRSTPTFFAGRFMLAGADANVAAALDSALVLAKAGKKPGN